MQEINHAGQESSARSSREARCRVCDGPVDWPNLVCSRCWQREREFEKWESYSADPDGDDTTPGNRGSAALKSRIRRAPILIVLCGPSHAGKTTFARRLCGKFMIISSDEIRKRLTGSFESSRHKDKVWDVFESMKCKALKEGHNLVLDACHISKEARWYSLQGPNAHHRKICVVFDSPFRTIRDRWLKEKRVSLKEVERMWKAFQNNKPTAQELKCQGFDEVCFVKE